MRINNTFCAITVIAALSLPGCSSMSNSEAVYDSEASRAYNLAQAGGIHQVRDTELGDKEYNSALSNLSDGIGTGLAFHSSTGLGMSAGGSIGMGLLSMMLEEPDAAEMDSIFGWVSVAKVDSKVEAQAFVIDSFMGSMKGLLESEGYKYESFSDYEKLDDGYASAIYIVNEDKNCPDLTDAITSRDQLCRFVVIVPEPKYTVTAPRFTKVGGKAYNFDASDYREGARIFLFLPEGSGLSELATLTKLSDLLPSGLFIYLAPDDTHPATVLDHGQSLLFITRKTP